MTREDEINAKCGKPGQARNRLFAEKHALLQAELINIEDETHAAKILGMLTPGDLAHRNRQAARGMAEILIHLGYIKTIDAISDYVTRGAVQ